MSTEEVLQKIKDMQNQIKKDVEENPKIKLTDQYINNMNINRNEEIKQENNEKIKNNTQEEKVPIAQNQDINNNYIEKIFMEQNNIENSNTVNSLNENIKKGIEEKNSFIPQKQDINSNYIEKIFMEQLEVIILIKNAHLLVM